MKTWRSLHLRTHLLFVVLVALLPAIGLAVYMGFRLRQNMADQATAENLRLARLIALDHERRLGLAQNTLITLAGSSQVVSLDLKACSVLFRRVVRQNAAFANVLLASPNGDIIASGVELDKPISVSDRPYFQKALQTRQFAIAGYVISRSTGKSARAMAEPILDDRGAVAAVLIGAFDLEQFGDVLERVQLPVGATVTVFDADGIILYRLPEAKQYVGKPVGKETLSHCMAEPAEGTYRGRGSVGEARLFAYVQAGGGAPDEKMFVRISVEEAMVYWKADQFLRRSLIGILCITLLVLLLTRYISERIILQPVTQLIRAAERVENGQVQTRSEIPYGHGEFGQLARAFDAMTDALAQRERQRDLVEEELRTAEEKLNATFFSIGDGVICTDTQARIVLMNPVAEGLTGWPLSLARAKPLSDVFHIADGQTRRPADSPVRDVLRDGIVVPAGVNILFSRQGKERLISTNSAPIRTKDGLVAGAVLVFRDITTEREAHRQA